MQKLCASAVTQINTTFSPRSVVLGFVSNLE